MHNKNDFKSAESIIQAPRPVNNPRRRNKRSVYAAFI